MDDREADRAQHDGLARVVLHTIDEREGVEEDLLRRDRVGVAANDAIVGREGVEGLVTQEHDEAVAEQARLEDRPVLLDALLVEPVIVAEDREGLTQPRKAEPAGWKAGSCLALDAAIVTSSSGGTEA